MNDVEVRLTRLSHGAELPLPSYQSAAAAGLDLVAAVAADAPVVIAPSRWAAIPTGLALELPPGSEGQVRPRSGLAAQHGVTVLNAPGTSKPPIWPPPAGEPGVSAQPGDSVAASGHGRPT